MTYKEAVVKVGKSGKKGLVAWGSGISQAQFAKMIANGLADFTPDKDCKGWSIKGIVKLNEWGKILCSEFKKELKNKPL